MATPHRSEHESPAPAAVRVREGARVAVVRSVYEGEITRALVDGARAAWSEAGGADDGLVLVDAPGSFELPQIAMALAESEGFDGVVALGCLIKGETRHDEYIASAVADGLMRVALDTGVPVAFGVLTTNTRGQAVDRSGGARGNKGAEAMLACLATMAVVGAEVGTG